MTPNPNTAIDLLNYEQYFIQPGNSGPTFHSPDMIGTSEGVFGDGACLTVIHEREVIPVISNSTMSDEIYTPKKLHLNLYSFRI